MKYVSCENAADKEITHRNEFLEVPLKTIKSHYGEGFVYHLSKCYRAGVGKESVEKLNEACCYFVNLDDLQKLVNPTALMRVGSLAVLCHPLVPF